MKEIEFINALDKIQLINYFRKLSNEDKIKLIENENLPKLNDESISVLFLNLDQQQASVFLKNEILYERVIKLNNKNRTILHILQESKPQIFKLLLESDYSSKYINYFLDYFKNIKIETFNQIIEQYDFNKIINYCFKDDKKMIFSYLKSKFDASNDILELFYSKVRNNKLNLEAIFKIENYKQFILYTKFGVIVNVLDNSEDIVLENGLVIPLNEIINCKDKYITKLIDFLKTKGKTNDETLLEASLKLYFTFGFDNAKKIIEDKFSKMNSSAILKVNDFEFKNERRKYRVGNPQKFYHYLMVEKVLDAIRKNDNEIFGILLYEDTPDKRKKLKEEFIQIISEIKTNEQIRKNIKARIDEQIKYREEMYKKENLKHLKLRNFQQPTMTADYLCELLKDVSLIKVLNYDSETLEKINKFLLGNAKENNDCLFRLIVNRSSLGLNDDIANLINNYLYVEQVINNSKLSLNSVLDVIDVLKVNLYELRPNEQDINLSTISRLLNACEFKVRQDVDVIKETCKLHLKRKEKIYSTIPTVKGQTDFFTYEVAPFDAEYLLTAGLDAKSCFRISGLGEDYFKYCLTNPNAVIVYLKDKKGQNYICPCIRSGNAINCNGIDPEVSDDLKNEAVVALQKCFVDMINISLNDKDSNEKIEVATLSNLHMLDYFSKYKYPTYSLEATIPLDLNCIQTIIKKTQSIIY